MPTEHPDGEGGSLERGASNAAPGPARSSPLWNVAARLLGLARAHQYNSRVADPDHEALRHEWNERLAEASERDNRRDAIARAYDGAVDRGIRVEAKAIGYLQILAIAAAIVTLVLTRDAVVLRVLSIAALIYLTAAALGCLDVLRLRSREQALVRDANSPSFGLAEAAVAAESMEQQHVRSSNSMFGAERDLKWGGAIALVSLVLMAFGLGLNSSSSPEGLVPSRRPCAHPSPHNKAGTRTGPPALHGKCTNPLPSGWTAAHR